MKIITLNGTKIKPDTVAAIGFFDGVHLAHQELINRAIKEGNDKNLRKAVITFDIHPKSIIHGLDYFYITPLERKLEILQTFDLDDIYVIEFTTEKAKLTPDEFIQYYLQGVNTIVCGFDFKFGVRGSGNVKTLINHPEIKTIVLNEITFEGHKLGSTLIRDLLHSGHVCKVNDILGDYYSLQGEVMHGAKKGRTIGYPTANIDSNLYLIPKQGVYATMTKVDDVWYKSMSSIGHNPTLNPQVNVSVESYLFDFDQDIYGKIIELKFIKRLRGELKFANAEELIKQINQDGKDTLHILNNL